MRKAARRGKAMQFELISQLSCCSARGPIAPSPSSLVVVVIAVRHLLRAGDAVLPGSGSALPACHSPVRHPGAGSTRAQIAEALRLAGGVAAEVSALWPMVLVVPGVGVKFDAATAMLCRSKLDHEACSRRRTTTVIEVATSWETQGNWNITWAPLCSARGTTQRGCRFDPPSSELRVCYRQLRSNANLGMSVECCASSSCVFENTAVGDAASFNFHRVTLLPFGSFSSRRSSTEVTVRKTLDNAKSNPSTFHPKKQTAPGLGRP